MVGLFLFFDLFSPLSLGRGPKRRTVFHPFTMDLIDPFTNEMEFVQEEKSPCLVNPGTHDFVRQLLGSQIGPPSTNAFTIDAKFPSRQCTIGPLDIPSFRGGYELNRIVRQELRAHNHTPLYRSPFCL